MGRQKIFYFWQSLLDNARLIQLWRDFLIVFLHYIFHQMLLGMDCAAVLVMPQDEVTIAAILDHFSFFPTAFVGTLPSHRSQDLTNRASRSVSLLENVK